MEKVEPWLAAAKELLIENEGTRTKLYRCTAGKNTIGVGHNLDANPIPQEAVDIIFDRDVQHVTEQLDAYFPWWRDKPKKVKVVLVDFVFNVGIGTALKFKNTMKLIEEDKFKRAGKALMKSRYAKQVPTRARRNAHLLESIGE